jgi:dolichyl-phosphate-mannose--protein O-mannosyl transferase
MNTKQFIKTKSNRFFSFLLVIASFLLLCFIMMGCANTQTSYREGFMPSGMAEDAQDYPTKYNMMDSPDGSKNPNAQVNIFGATY